MYERGIVTSVEKNIVTIKCGKPDQCKACSSSFCNISSKNFLALNRNGLDIREGDTVEVYISPAKTIGFSFMVLIFPLLMFITGYYLTGSIFHTSSDGLKALGGIAGLVCGFGLSFLYNIIKKNQNLPVVTEKL